MKVVLDFRKYDGVVGGSEQVALQVLKYLTSHDNNVLLLCKKGRIHEVERMLAETKRLELLSLDTSTHNVTVKNIYMDTATIQEIALQHRADIIHFTYNWSFPIRKKVPCVLTLHDVIPLAIREDDPWWYNKLVYRPAVRWACRLNDSIVTISNHSKKDIVSHSGISGSKVTVIYHGVRMPHRVNYAGMFKTLDGRLAIGSDFILTVGGIHERKNIVRLVEAFDILLRRHGYGGNLVITGKHDEFEYLVRMKRRCDEAVKKHGLEDRVIFSGYVSEEEIDVLMKKCRLLMYPSLYEGFGMPILEEMVRGRPVVTSNVTAMPEIAGGAALLVDPCDAGDMAGGMARVLSDESLQKELIEKGKKHVKSFSWEKAGRLLVDLYESLL